MARAGNVSDPGQMYGSASTPRPAGVAHVSGPMAHADDARVMDGVYTAA